MTLLIGISTIALILLIFFRTDGFVEYSRLLGFDGISFYRDFDEKSEHDVSLTYHQYLRYYHNCFIVRLVTCPICLSVWLGLVICLVGTLTTLNPHYLLLMPIITTGGLLVFTTIDRLLG